MVSHAGAGGVRPFLKLLEVQALRGAADRDLLRRFAAAADEAAFRVIAERHGPMVFGVCARLLGNRHDAEDALQATFLVLARRAAAVRSSESLASWLHGVARRVAARLRRADRRRAARERAAAAPDAHAPADALGWAEARAGLDEELGRLPAAYREVLVLCYLEGLTRDEAGQRLGIEPGAVKGRLERGRRLLGERLARRGIGLSAGLAGLAVAPPATAALRLARLAADPAAASPRAAALTHEFLKGVAMTKLKLLTAGLAGVLVLAAGVGTAQQPPPPAKAAPGEKAGPIGLGKFGAEPVKDTDEAFIRRVSLDLRGTEPTPAEVHFFLASKDANKRTVLVDLFVKERTAKATPKGSDPGAMLMAVDVAKLLDRQRTYEAMVREQAARAEAERAAAERATAERATAEERAAWAARMAKLGYLNQAQAEAERARAAADAQRAAALRDARLRAELEEQLVRAAEAQARAERERAAAEKAAADAKLRGAAEALQQEAAKRSGTVKGFREPADPNRLAEPRPAPPTPADPTGRSKTPPAAVPPPPAPVSPPVGVRPPPSPMAPPAIAPAAPAPVPPPNVALLHIRVQLAEVTLREKTLHLENTENLFKNKVVSSRELDLAKLEVERARLQLEEAQLTLSTAGLTRPAEPRSVPPSPARP